MPSASVLDLLESFGTLHEGDKDALIKGKTKMIPPSKRLDVVAQVGGERRWNQNNRLKMSGRVVGRIAAVRVFILILRGNQSLLITAVT